MKTLTTSLSVLALIVGLTFISGGSALAQTCDSTRSGFVDMNGDGFNDNAPDHDGDGIPNGQDPDWIKNPQDGTGYMHKNMKGTAAQTQNKGEDKPGVQNRAMKKLGPADGSGNQYQNQNKNENGTLTRTQTKAQLKQKFQSKAQAFTRTQTMSHVRQQLRDGSCGDGSASGGAGSGSGSGSGVCDGTGPKGNGKGGNK